MTKIEPMTTIEFICTVCQSSRSEWAAIQAGFKLCYTPAFGNRAVLLFHRECGLAQDERETFTEIIFQAIDNGSFVFTVKGFKIDIPTKVFEHYFIRGKLDV